MKKFLSIILAAVIGFSITGCHDDSRLQEDISDLQKRVSQLELLCSQLNTNLVGIQTLVNSLSNNDYITAVTPIQNGEVVLGYTITFLKGAPITIYNGKDGNDGNDGKTPDFSIKQDTDGNYYWVLNGEWMVDSSGNRVNAGGNIPQLKIENSYWHVSYDGGTTWSKLQKATGEDGQTPQISAKKASDGLYYWTVDGNWLYDSYGNKVLANNPTPKFKIENDYWYVSTDNGVTWTKLSKARGENGKDGDAFFKSVDNNNDDYVIFTLVDGTTFKVARYKSFDITFEMGTNISIAAGSTIDIPYVLTGTTDATIVALAQGEWVAKVVPSSNTEGVVRVTAPNPLTDIPVIVMVSSGTQTITRSLSFVQGISTIANENYIIASPATIVSVSVKTNMVYTVSIPTAAQSWISLQSITTKAQIRDEVINLSILENPSKQFRSSTITLVSGNTNVGTIKIYQQGVNISNNEIYYTSSTGKVVNPHQETGFGVSIVSNTYSNGKGVIICSGDITQIGKQTFSGCSTIKTITLPPSIRVIRDNAFSDCSGINELDIPEGVEEIGMSIFGENSSLKTLTLPSTLKILRYLAFHNCGGLKTVYCKAINPPSILNNNDTVETSTGPFDNPWSYFGMLYVPNQSLSIYKTTTAWSHYASNMEGWMFD